MSFSIKVKHALVDADMNPSELARKTGYSVMYVHNLLNGRRRWNEEAMLKACDALGLELRVIPKEVDRNLHGRDGKAYCSNKTVEKGEINA